MDFSYLLSFHVDRIMGSWGSKNYKKKAIIKKIKKALWAPAPKEL